jgi:hypothetical protein
MHFYNKDGQLFDTDIREARKLGLVPSVTEITKEFSNSYGLDLYKQKQMFLASLTMPRPERITDEAFYDLVVEDSLVHSEKARQFGIDVHAYVTEILKGGYAYNNPECFHIKNDKILKKANQIVAWIKANKDNCIIDFKTQETKDGKFKQPYDSWLLQLCGYYLYFLGFPKMGEFNEYEFYHDKGYGGKIDYALITPKDALVDTKLINLIVSSNEDIPIKVYPWKPEKVEWGCKCFLKMVELYHAMKKLN